MPYYWPPPHIFLHSLYCSFFIFHFNVEKRNWNVRFISPWSHSKGCFVLYVHCNPVITHHLKFITSGIRFIGEGSIMKLCFFWPQNLSSVGFVLARFVITGLLCTLDLEKLLLRFVGRSSHNNFYFAGKMRTSSYVWRFQRTQTFKKPSVKALGAKEANGCDGILEEDSADALFAQGH